MSNFYERESEIESISYSRYLSPINRVQAKKALKKDKSVKVYDTNIAINSFEYQRYEFKPRLNRSVVYTGQNDMDDICLNKSNSVVNFNNFGKNGKNPKIDFNVKTPIKRDKNINTFMGTIINSPKKNNDNNEFKINKAESCIDKDLINNLRSNNNIYNYKTKKVETKLRKKYLSIDDSNPGLTTPKNDPNYYCIKCYNRKLIPHDNTKLPFKNLNKSYDAQYYNSVLELKKIDEDHICNRVLKNEERQLKAFNNLKQENIKNSNNHKAKLQYINENEDNTLIGLNLQDYLYYNNKKNNEFLNNSMIENIKLYNVNKPRKAVKDYYKKVQYQIPILEKSLEPSDKYKSNFIETLKNQINDKAREKNTLHKLKLQTEFEENKKYSEYLSKLKRDENEQKRLKRKMLLDNNNFMKEYQNQKDQLQRKDNQYGSYYRQQMFQQNQKDYQNFVRQQKINEIISLQNWINENIRQQQKKMNNEFNDTKRWDEYNKEYQRKYYDNTHGEKCAECNALYPMEKLLQLPKK